MYLCSIWNVFTWRSAPVFSCYSEKNSSFSAPQLFKNLASLELKLRMTNKLDMIVWIGIVTPCHCRKNWMQMNPKTKSKNLVERLVVNWFITLIRLIHLFWQTEISASSIWKRTPLTVSKLNTLNTDEFTYELDIYGWITGPSSSNSICFKLKSRYCLENDDAFNTTKKITGKKPLNHILKCISLH